MVGSRERDRDRTRDRDKHRSEKHRSSRRSMGHNSRSRRSPDSYYRTDNSDEDSYDNSRRYRSHDHRRHDSDRSRSRHRSRDRSRSRDRDRLRDGSTAADDSVTTSGANTHNSRHYNEYNSCDDSANDKNDFYDRDRDRDRGDRSHYQRDKREEQPNNTLMIRGLAAHITEADIISKLAEHELQAKDIRLMRKKETGISRGFAFVEFAILEDAVRWKHLTQGYLLFGDESDATIHYSIPKDSLMNDKNVMKNDWTCYKCGVNNFKRRDECFKCGTPKEESLANDTGDEISLTPTNALLFRNLSSNTTEERILTILGSLTSLPIKSIRILKDATYNTSRGICLVELHTTLEASQLFTLLSSLSYEFIIDDCTVQVNYGKRNVTLAHITSNTSNAATIALAAAQWRNLDEGPKAHSQTSKNANKSSGNSTSGVVCVNGVEYTKYKEPDVSSFQFDETSGYYYDSSTGFYYDSNTQYYYNPQSQQYMYWDASNQTYLSAESNTQTNEESKKEKPKESKEKPHDKVKIAKKIAKDMEKWAKTLNQKKDSARVWTPTEPMAPEISQTSVQTKSSSADAGFALMEQLSSAETEPTVESTVDTKSLMTSNALQLLKEEENRLIDWQKMACLLCKRQFPSAELLTKHQQLSDLHKSNLNMLKHRVLSEEQIEDIERTERESGYRDRAKERRKKYGLPETPEIINNSRSKYGNEIEDIGPSSDASNTPLASDNIGSKMMKAMGWTEGTGLGKANQGISNIIEVERRTEGAGLGMQANTPLAPGETYKDAVRRTMQMRFKQMD